MVGNETVVGKEDVVGLEEATVRGMKFREVVGWEWCVG